MAWSWVFSWFKDDRPLAPFYLGEDRIAPIRYRQFMDTPCTCNGIRKRCTPECTHPPNFRKECMPLCGEKCKSRQLPRRWKPMKVYVEVDDFETLEGATLMANEDAKPGRIIMPYQGIAHFFDMYYERWIKPDYGKKTFMECFDEFVIDGREQGNEAAFARHSCTPNCDAELYYEKRGSDIAPRIMLVTNQRIRKGDELTYTYNVNNVDYLPNMVCFCGRVTCPDFLRNPLHDIEQRRSI